MNSASIKEYFALFGLKVADKVTGFRGVVTSISFDLYGCVQAVVSPGADENGGLEDARWFDVKRLESLGPEPVMTLPTFDVVPGPEAKPSPATQPIR